MDWRASARSLVREKQSGREVHGLYRRKTDSMKKEWSMFPFREWREIYFPLTSRHGSYGSTCGSAALAMIVDVEPGKIEHYAKCNRRNPFDVPDAQRVLKKYGFESHWFEGPQGLVNLGRDAHWAGDELRHEHLILFTADTTKREASWFVGYGGAIYHNGSRFSTTPLFGLTNPMIDLLLVRRKKKR